MSIEFRCPHCQRLLRVPEGSQGKQAQCPQCQAMVQVPAGGAPAAAPPAASPGAANPFATNFPPAATGLPSDNPYQSPAASFDAPQAAIGAGVLPIVPTKMDLGDVLNRTWEIYKSQLGMLILIIFAAIGINMGTGMINNVVALAVNAATNDMAIRMISQGFVQIVLAVFQIWLGIGQTRFMLKVGRGQPAEFSDLFTGGPYLINTLLASLLMGLAMAAVAVPLAAPPGIAWLVTKGDQQVTLMVGFASAILFLPVLAFVGLSFSQFQHLIIDRNMGVMDSLRTSYEIMSGNRLLLFVYGIIATFLYLLGALACCVGILFTLPYCILGMSVAYLVITGQPTADQLMRGAPPMQMPPPGSSPFPPA